MKWYETKERLSISTRLTLLAMLILEISQVVSLFIMFYSFIDGLLMFGCCLGMNILLRISFKKQTGLEM